MFCSLYSLVDFLTSLLHTLLKVIKRVLGLVPPGLELVLDLLDLTERKVTCQKNIVSGFRGECVVCTRED